MILPLYQQIKGGGNSVNTAKNKMSYQTLAQKQFAEFATYTEGLKYKSAFKYVKGLTPSKRTLANILYSRGKAGEFAIELSPKEIKAFGLGDSDKPLMYCASMAILTHGVTFLPLCTPEEYNENI